MKRYLRGTFNLRERWPGYLAGVLIAVAVDWWQGPDVWTRWWPW